MSPFDDCLNRKTGVFPTTRAQCCQHRFPNLCLSVRRLRRPSADYVISAVGGEVGEQRHAAPHPVEVMDRGQTSAGGRAGCCYTLGESQPHHDPCIHPPAPKLFNFVMLSSQLQRRRVKTFSASKKRPKTSLVKNTHHPRPSSH